MSKPFEELRADFLKKYSSGLRLPETPLGPAEALNDALCFMLVYLGDDPRFLKLFDGSSIKEIQDHAQSIETFLKKTCIKDDEELIFDWAIARKEIMALWLGFSQKTQAKKEKLNKFLIKDFNFNSYAPDDLADLRLSESINALVFDATDYQFPPEPIELFKLYSHGQFLLQLDAVLKAKNIRLKRLTLQQCNNKALMELNEFFSKPNHVDFEVLVLNLGVIDVSIENFLLFLKSIAQGKNPSLICIEDSAKVFSDMQWHIFLKALQELNIHFEVQLPVNYQGLALQKKVDEQVDKNHQEFLLQSLGQKNTNKTKILPFSRMPTFPLKSLELPELIQFYSYEELKELLLKRRLAIPAADCLLTEEELRHAWALWTGDLVKWYSFDEFRVLNKTSPYSFNSRLLEINGKKEVEVHFKTGMVTHLGFRAIKVLLAQRRRFFLGLEHAQLPAGFFLIKQGSSYLLDYQKTALVSQQNGLAPKIIESKEWMPRSTEAVEALLSDLDQTKPALNFLYQQWLELRTHFPYQRDALMVLSRHMVTLIHFECEELVELFALVKIDGKIKAPVLNFFLMNYQRIDEIFSLAEGFEGSVAIAKRALQRVLTNTTQLDSFLALAARMTEKIRQTLESKLLFYQVLDSSKNLLKKYQTYEMLCGFSNESFQSLLEIYIDYGFRGLQELMAIWEKMDQEILSLVFQTLFKSRHSFSSWLESDDLPKTLMAMVKLKRDEANAYQWWTLLLEQHAAAVIDDDLVHLFSCFQAFHTQIVQESLTFYLPCQFSKALSLPTVLARILDILLTVHPLDREGQWSCMTELSFAVDGASLFLKSPLRSQRSAGFVVPEMRINYEDFDFYTGYHYLPDLNEIKAAQDLNEAKYRFYSFLAYQSARIALSFYQEALKDIDAAQWDLNHKIDCYFALASGTACHQGQSLILPASSSLKKWKKIFQKIKGNEFFSDSTALDFFIEELRQAFLELHQQDFQPPSHMEEYCLKLLAEMVPHGNRNDHRYKKLLEAIGSFAEHHWVVYFLNYLYEEQEIAYEEEHFLNASYFYLQELVPALAKAPLQFISSSGAFSINLLIKFVLKSHADDLGFFYALSFVDESTEALPQPSYAAFLMEKLTQILLIPESYQPLQKKIHSLIKRFFQRIFIDLKQEIEKLLLIKAEFFSWSDLNLMESVLYYFSEKRSFPDINDCFDFLSAADYQSFSLKEKMSLIKIWMHLLDNGKPPLLEELIWLLAYCKENKESFQDIKKIYMASLIPSLAQLQYWAMYCRGSLLLLHRDEFQIRPGERLRTPFLDLPFCTEILKKLNLDAHFRLEPILNAFAQNFTRVRQLRMQAITEELLEVFDHRGKGKNMAFEYLILLLAELLYRINSQNLQLGFDGQVRQELGFDLVSLDYIFLYALWHSGREVILEWEDAPNKDKILVLIVAARYLLGGTVDFIFPSIKLAEQFHRRYHHFFRAISVNPKLLLKDSDKADYFEGSIYFSDVYHMSRFRREQRLETSAIEASKRTLVLYDAAKSFQDLCSLHHDYEVLWFNRSKLMPKIYEAMIFLLMNLKNKAKKTKINFSEFIKAWEKDAEQLAEAYFFKEALKDLSHDFLSASFDLSCAALQLTYIKDYIIERDQVQLTPDGPKIFRKACLLSELSFSPALGFFLNAALNVFSHHHEWIDDPLLLDVMALGVDDFMVGDAMNLEFVQISKSFLDDYEEGRIYGFTQNSASIEEGLKQQIQRKGVQSSKLRLINLSFEEPADDGKYFFYVAKNTKFQIELILKEALIFERSGSNVAIFFKTEEAAIAAEAVLKLEVIDSSSLKRLSPSSFSEPLDQKDLSEVFGQARLFLIPIDLLKLPQFSSLKIQKNLFAQVIFSFLADTAEIFQAAWVCHLFEKEEPMIFVVNEAELKTLAPRGQLIDACYRFGLEYATKAEMGLEHKKNRIRILIKAIAAIDSFFVDYFMEKILVFCSDKKTKSALQDLWTDFEEGVEERKFELMLILRQKINDEDIPLREANHLMQSFEAECGELWLSLLKKISLVYSSFEEPLARLALEKKIKTKIGAEFNTDFSAYRLNLAPIEGIQDTPPVLGRGKIFPMLRAYWLGQMSLGELIFGRQRR